MVNDSPCCVPLLVDACWPARAQPRHGRHAESRLRRWGPGDPHSSCSSLLTKAPGPSLRRWRTWCCGHPVMTCCAKSDVCGHAGSAGSDVQCVRNASLVYARACLRGYHAASKLRRTLMETWGLGARLRSRRVLKQRRQHDARVSTTQRAVHPQAAGGELVVPGRPLAMPAPPRPEERGRSAPRAPCGCRDQPDWRAQLWPQS